MKKHLFLFILTLAVLSASNVWAGTIDFLTNPNSYTLYTENASLSGSSIISGQNWCVYGWDLSGEDCSSWESFTVTYDNTVPGGGIKCLYDDSSQEWADIYRYGNNPTSATISFNRSKTISKVFVQVEGSGQTLTLNSAYITFEDPIDPCAMTTIQCETYNSSLFTSSRKTENSETHDWGNPDGEMIQNNSDGKEFFYYVELPEDANYTFKVHTSTKRSQNFKIYSLTGEGSDDVGYGGQTYYQKGSSTNVDASNESWNDYYAAPNAPTISLSKGKYVIGLSCNSYARFDKIVIVADDEVFCESSCTAPNHVDISGRWDRFGGETISLTATAYSSAGTGSPIADANITGWQWQKLISTTWTDVSNGADGTATISGATTKNLQISNCHMDNSGKYRCVVSTGATCSTASATATDGSEGYRVRVYTLEHYTGGTTQYNFTRIGDTQTGSVEVTLSANTGHQFKIHGDEYFGNNGTINFDENNWTFTSSGNNVTVNSGLGGTFTFTIDYSSNGAAPVLAVTYPRKAVYLNPNADWKKDNAKFAFYYFHKTGETTNKEGWTDFLSPSVCDGNVYPATIPQWNGVQIIGVRFNSTKTSTGNFDEKWNQTSDLTLTSNDLVTITGWDNSQTYNSSYDAPEYKIFFVKNGADGGSDMSDVEDIECDGSVTLDANTWTKTGYDFDGWNDGSSDYADEATISNITSDITLTAQWAPKTTSVTLDANIANHGATGSSVIATWGTTLPDFAAATGVSGYALTGYFTAPTGGTKIINADGTLAASTTYTTADRKWNSELSALTLYPQYESSISSKTVPCSLDFYYTEVGGAQGKDILNSDFSYSCNKDYAKNDQHNPYQQVCFSGSGVYTLTSRMNVVFPQTGTYKFTFPLYIKERVSDLDAPRVTVNGSQSDAAYISTDGEENQNFTTTLNVTAGTYTVSVWIGNTNEKIFFSTMEIDSYQCRNIITTGAVGLFDSEQGSGGGASYTCSSVADPECHFDHNVFCFEYSNMGGNRDNYYGCRLTSGPAYTPNAAATGFAFWYRTESSSDPVYMEFAGKTYNLEATDGAWHYTYVASSRAGSKSGEFDIWINGEKDGFSTTQSSGKIYLSELQATNVTSADPIAPATTHTITVASNNNTYGTVSSTPTSGSSVTDCASITVTATPESGYSFVEWKKGDTQVSTDASYTFTMGNLNDGSDLTLTAYFQQDELTISSLPWAGDQDLTQIVVSADAINSCFDSEITFTFTGDGTVSYYDNTNRSSSLGTVTSGTAITLNDNLRTHGIYIECTSGDATLTEVSKTTIGSVYQIWSGNVAVGSWSEQVVLGPEHFQTAIVGDVLRVNTSGEGGDAQGALQYILTEGDSHTYKGLDDYTDGGLHNWDLTSGEKDQHYFEITINATHLANLKRYGVIVKGRYYTIQSVELRASCSNRSMRTTAPDITRYADVNIMTTNIDFGAGFTLGNWEHKLELDESCFTSVTVGSVINLYMSVDGDATLSFRCNVDSVHAKSYGTPPLCPSYGDISFDRTIDDLYGDAPAVVGTTEGYKVLYLLVDADMRRRLQETGMILCGKGTLIKVVEGVPDTVVVNSNEERHVPTVVNNLIIYQGGQVTNTEDIEVLGKITYIRHAKGGALSNKLDQWYTFAVPFTVSDVEVYDETDKAWFDINAVYYSDDDKDQATNNPDGKGHYYLQYLKAENETAIGSAFAARWQYITPGHSEHLYAEDWSEYRYGYPKKDSAYIILFDSDQPRELPSGYWESNPTIRFVGVGPQTIDGVAKVWKVEAEGEQYWMYANNTLHSFTLNDAYILNDAGTEFVLQESPTIRPFECYVQATESLKKKNAAIPMRGFHIDNTTTGAESIQGSAIRAEKILRNGQLIIIRNGVEYDATGVVIR